MKEFPASVLTRKASDLFEAAAVAPVVITRRRKPRFVVMSVDHYEALLRSRLGFEGTSWKGSLS